MTIDHCTVIRVLILILTMTTKNSQSNFPDTLEGFGYAFNKAGELRKIDPETNLPGNEVFEFNVKTDAKYNQKRYEALGEILTEHIYKLLESEAGLKRLPVPPEGPVDQSSFIFASDGALGNTEKLLIIIHGSGVVRAGQWARSLIINDCLKTGTQLPFISRAQELGYAVLVLNSNDNERVVDGKTKSIPGSEDPDQHCNSVWETYVRKAKAKHIAIIAHSFGGVCTVHLALQHLSEFKERVFAVALTDSVHSFALQKVPSDVAQPLIKVGRNWVSSREPLDTPLPGRNDIERVSAGHPKHEMTSWSSYESVFGFLEERYQAVTRTKEELSVTVDRVTIHDQFFT